MTLLQYGYQPFLNNILLPDGSVILVQTCDQSDQCSDFVKVPVKLNKNKYPLSSGNLITKEIVTTFKSGNIQKMTGLAAAISNLPHFNVNLVYLTFLSL